MKKLLKSQQKSFTVALAALFAAIGLAACLIPATAFAVTPQFCQQNGQSYDPTTQTCTTNTPSTTTTPSSGSSPSTPTVPSVTPLGDPQAKGGNCASATNCDLMSKYINPAIRLLSALVGIAVTISIIYGGIEYSSSGGDPQKAAAGKSRIVNALIALLAYLFLGAILNFIIPGGIV